MAVTFTWEQLRAIDLHGCNILVSAAAGSGKTAVLVERITKMVCDEQNPVDIDRLLIVTFTNAAAAEMRERIGAGISRRLSECPESEHIQRQATLLHNAQITTIDSFCLFLLRNHFNEIGLDPAFRIADEGEIKLMQQDVLGELMEDSYASESRSFRFCVEFFCPGGKESVLEQYILKLSRYAASFPFPEQWLEARKEDYRGGSVQEICASRYAEWLLSYLRRMAAGCAEKLRRVCRLCEVPDGPYMYGELVERELEQLERLSACASLEEWAVKLPAVMFGRLPSKKDDSVDPVKRELARELRGEVKESLKALEERFFATSLELAARQSGACREPVETLIDLVLDFDRRMREKKQEKKLIDFSDMEHFALDILLDRQGEEVRPSSVALEYRQYFTEILIDEYQDSNLVQEYLLRAVSGEEEGCYNRFMVGDVKQSIYKFRLARPELFLEKYETYVQDLSEDGVMNGDSGKQDTDCREGGIDREEPGEREDVAGQEAPGKREGCRGENCRRIDLARNFRSRVQVIDAVNDVFSRMMSAEVGGIAYDHAAALYPGAVYPENGDCVSELLLINKPDKDGETGTKQAEAMAIAGKIKSLRELFLVTDRDSGKVRPARYSDMVILLRTNSGWDEEFKEVLEQEGIPVYITARTGYFAATEVQELLQLLRVLDNPSQDISLFGVMKSIFGGFSEEEISRIRSQARECSLYEALKRFAAEEGEDGIRIGQEPGGEGAGRILMEQELREETEGRTAPADREETDLRRRAADFLRMLDGYRACTVYLPVRELLTRLIQDFGYLDYVTALPAGSRRRANVEMLLTRASDFEKTSYFGLFHFIRYMEQLEKYDVDYGGAEQLDENADVVRIMSIHRSKGLEFPITFVAGLGKRFNMQDVNQALILDMDLGLGTDYVDPDRRIRNKTLRRTALAGKQREEILSEELRLLYVAMTRAREKLIMTGVAEEAGKVWERRKLFGGERLSYLDFMEAGSFLDFLLPVLPDTCVAVSVVEEADIAAGEMTEQIRLSGRREALEQAVQGDESEAERRLRACLNAGYPHAALADLYTKTTVSELKIAAMADRDEAAFHTFEEKEIQPYIPLFRRGEEQVSGAVRGNAYHKVMELLDFDALTGGESVLADRLHVFLLREVEEKRLTEAYYNVVNERKIVRFLQTPLADRMRQAGRKGRLYREQPFVLGIDARRLKSDFPSTETVLIQGIIDVFFEEDDGLVLLDYKTDSVSSMQQLWNRYETQLDYYQEAVEKIYGKPVKERVLYSFHLERYE